jgi:hypothetical protein
MSMGAMRALHAEQISRVHEKLEAQHKLALNQWQAKHTAGLAESSAMAHGTFRL